MWVLALILVALAGAARAEDCDACIAGRCHARRTLLAGTSVTDQLAIDRTRNVLYTQLDHEDIIAIHLDEPSIRKVLKMKSKGLAFDQKNQFLYFSKGRIIYTYKYDEEDDIHSTVSVDAVYALGRRTSPVRLRYEDTLYTINADGSSGYYSKTYERFAGWENLQDYNVTDMVNVKDITNWFFISDNKLYRFVISSTNEESWHIVSDSRHVLAIDGYGYNYFADPSQKIIYKLDRETGELEEYGSYKSGSVEDFVFDRDGNILFVDAGGVARWVPGYHTCDVVPRAGTNRVDDLTLEDDYAIYFIREWQNKLSSPTPAASADYYSYDSSEH